MGYVKKPVMVGESMYLPIDRAIIRYHDITKNCLVEFNILGRKILEDEPEK